MNDCSNLAHRIVVIRIMYQQHLKPSLSKIIQVQAVNVILMY